MMVGHERPLRPKIHGSGLHQEMPSFAVRLRRRLSDAKKFGRVEGLPQRISDLLCRIGTGNRTLAEVS